MKITKLAALAATASVTSFASPALAIPTYSHVVVVIEENEDPSAFTSAANAPYINGTLIPGGTVLTNSQAIGHPSEPNYLQLFSGSAQGTQGTDGPVPGSLAPAGSPSTGTGLNVPNLGASVIAAGKTFAGYSENLSSAADPLAYNAGGASGALYARKHNPWSDFISSVGGQYTLPASTNQDFSNFQAISTSGNFASLPTLSFVAPNQCNDAHGTAADCPTNSVNIGLADTFLKNNLSAYATWAKANNSLLIVTTDEGNTTIGTDPATGLPLTNVLTVLYGAGIAPGGSIGTAINEYGLCGLIANAEQASAPAACGSAAAQAQAVSVAAQLSTVPEPASLALLGFGSLALLVRRRLAG